MKRLFATLTFASIIPIIASTTTYAAPCTFDNKKNCALQRDILNDLASGGLHYYASTNYDHRMSGEINVYDATLVQPYTDNKNAPGQLRLLARLTNNAWRSGEIMTRANLNQAPYNSPVASMPWTTKDIQHGYLEVVVKMPRCDSSNDGLCQAKTNPINYSKGLWPAIWMMPSMDANWPVNGEIDIAEAYPLNKPCLNVTTAALHFNGNDSRCTDSDCRGAGFRLADHNIIGALYNDFHTWGFEWQPDPNSATGGVLMTGYFDNVKIWGPLTSSSLPADGPNAFSRGFNDSIGGFYLIVNLAVGGPYAGAPNPQMTAASMYLQSAKAFTVTGDTPPPPPPSCPSPTNVKSTFTSDMKSITLKWETPADSSNVTSYQVNNADNVMLFKGAGQTFVDNKLPGTPGQFTYHVLSNCADQSSTPVTVVVNVSAPTTGCKKPRAIKGTYTKDKKSITLTWQDPITSAPIKNYQVNDYQNKKMWEGKDADEQSFTDGTLPGEAGEFTYYLYSNCENGKQSASAKKVVTIK